MTQPVQYHYGKFPPAELEWKQLIPLIGPASAALARYDGTLNAVPNPQRVTLAPGDPGSGAVVQEGREVF